jgi:hypothetical protein
MNDLKYTELNNKIEFYSTGCVTAFVVFGFIALIVLGIVLNVIGYSG